MRYLIVIFLCLGFIGCASVGTMPHIMGTQTDLSKKNYKVVQTGVRGEDTGFSLLWFIDIISPTHSNAMEDLHSKIEMKGKSMALANVARDMSRLNLIVFSIPKITITADVVEFLDENVKSSE